MAKRCNRIMGADGDLNWIRCGRSEGATMHDPIRPGSHVFDPAPVCEEDLPALYEHGSYYDDPRTS